VGIETALLAAGIGAAGKIAGGAIASSGAKKAATAQEQAARDAQAAQERMFQKQIELQEPFRQAGLTAQQQIMQLLGIGGDTSAAGYGSLAKPFGAEQFQQDPGYAFRQSEGMKALERSAAARGGLLSGSTMKGIQRFGQDLASQEYQNAFNRYQVERAARLNPLQSLMGSGQSAANVLTGAAGQAGQNEAANLYGAGQARASGYIGSANALASALGGAAGVATDYPLYKAQIGAYNRVGTSNPFGGFGSSDLPSGTVLPSQAPINKMLG
jgi:hypothetical protein